MGRKVNLQQQGWVCSTDQNQEFELFLRICLHTSTCLIEPRESVMQTQYLSVCCFFTWEVFDSKSARKWSITGCRVFCRRITLALLPSPWRSVSHSRSLTSLSLSFSLSLSLSLRGFFLSLSPPLSLCLSLFCSSWQVPGLYNNTGDWGRSARSDASGLWQLAFRWLSFVYRPYSYSHTCQTCIRSNTHIYIHVYIHTYIQAYIHTPLHTCILAYLHTRAFIHSYIYTGMPSTHIHAYMYALTTHIHACKY